MSNQTDSEPALPPHLNLEIKRLNRIRLAGSFLAVPLLLSLVYLTAQPKLYPWLMRATGLLLIAGGIGTRLWARSCIGTWKKRKLVTWGPYGHVRHPLYCGSLLLGIGACVFAGAPIAGVITGAVYLALYVPSIRAEEQFLTLRFTEWSGYSARVRAFIPRLRSATPAGDRMFESRWPLRDSIELISVGGLAIVAGEWLRSVHPGDTTPIWWL